MIEESANVCTTLFSTDNCDWSLLFVSASDCKEPLSFTSLDYFYKLYNTL